MNTDPVQEHRTPDNVDAMPDAPVILTPIEKFHQEYHEQSADFEAIEDEYARAKKAQAQKDMTYGALWCIGGIVFTVADIGFIFWGAIVFGGIQFFKGLANNN